MPFYTDLLCLFPVSFSLSQFLFVSFPPFFLTRRRLFLSPDLRPVSLLYACFNIGRGAFLSLFLHFRVRFLSPALFFADFSLYSRRARFLCRLPPASSLICLLCLNLPSWGFDPVLRFFCPKVSGFLFIRRLQFFSCFRFGRRFF